jgi:hypothetical protein
MRHTTSIAKQQQVNVMESSPVSVASERQVHPDLNDNRALQTRMKHIQFSRPTSARIIAYMKHILDLEQVPYEDQSLNDIVMITNYDSRN